MIAPPGMPGVAMIIFSEKVYSDWFYDMIIDKVNKNAPLIATFCHIIASYR